MYRSWKTLLITQESDLRSQERIRKLYRSRSHVSLLVIIGFAFAGCISLLVAASLLVVQGYFASIIMVGMAALCFHAARLFQKERNLDPIHSFLKNPDGYEFVKGEIVSATYNANENRRNSRMLIKGKGKTLAGEPLLFFESFAPDIWPFINAGENENLKPGDDQYDSKGKKRTLPVPIYVIYQKRSGAQPDSVEVTAALVGIDKELIEPIESTLRRRRSWLPRRGKT